YFRGAGIGPVFSHLPRRSCLASGPLQNPVQLTLATDEVVAATVTGDLLRRPTVVAQVTQEDKVLAVGELFPVKSVCSL
ncbi:DUF6192 family protein, partial [Streptomyces sp. NPDC001185]|uniref:DUF6192 family protein n=1 Tax=Streptomyces sp. NPDC001185 TaxID=3154380 RepID=UPI0033184BCF